MSKWLASLALLVLCACPGTPPAPADGGSGAELDGGAQDAGVGTPDAGAEPVCGNGATEPGEACDDGNALSGDGCSGTCAAEASCEVAVPFESVAVSTPTGSQQVEGTLAGRTTASLLASCGGTGPEQVFTWTAPSAGLLRAVLHSDQPLTLSLRTTCVEAGSEVACAQVDAQLERTVSAGEAVSLVVDSPAGLTAADFTLAVQLLPVRASGEACDAAGLQDRCAAGLRCDGSLPLPRCVANSAPSLSAALALKTGRLGNDLYLSADGTDAEGDVQVLRVTGKDSTGQALATATWPTREGLLAPGAFHVTAVVRGYFTQHPSVSTLDVLAVDSGQLASVPRSQAVTSPAAPAAGAACDPEELRSLCAPGFACPPSAPTCTAGTAPVLSRAAFVEPGNGLPRRLLLSGHDSEGDVARVLLQFLDASGQPVAVSFGGAPAASTLAVPVTSAPASAPLLLQLSAATLPSNVTRIGVELEDFTLLKSARLEPARGPLPTPSAGQPCDAEHVFDLCAAPLACTGSPATCTAGTAPTLDRAAYLDVASGPVIFLEGTDVDRDLAGVRLEFLDAAGQPVLLLDGNGDGVADQSESFVSTPGVEATDGGYFIPVDVAQVADLSPRMAATVTDYAGLSSARVLLQRAFPPVRAEGEGCSVRGFDTCEAGTRCWGTPAAAQCLGLSALQPQVCQAAPALSGAGTTQGDTLPVSLWDPPQGCAAGDPHGAVEGVVRLTLLAPAAVLTLSTDHPGTMFDTVLTLLPTCGVGLPLGCNDDVNTALGQRRSTLVLQNVPAGEYLVVVDGFDAAGGHFVLSAGVQ